MTEHIEEIAAPAEVTLDMGGHYPLRVVVAEGNRHRFEIDLSKSTRDIFFHHLQQLLQLEVQGQTLAHPQKTKFGHRLQFPLPPLKAGDGLLLRMNGQPVSALVYNGTSLNAAADHAQYQLSISETRALGRKLRRDPDPARDVLRLLPYDRAARKGFHAKIHAPLTDVHTHSSAQISGNSLMNVALEEDIHGAVHVCYPLELLALLGVPCDPAIQTPEAMQSRAFNPTKHDGLECEQDGVECDGLRVSELTNHQKSAIIAKMDIPADATMSFSDFDREMYRYRNPLVKHPALTKPILRKMAQDYAADGVRYAELSTGSMMDPAWFKEMAEVVKEIDDAGGTRLRFLVGLPRNASPQRTLIDIDKIKYLARHPYIVGADLLGYESNKTSEFNWALAHLAQWAKASEGSDLNPADGWDFKRDFIIRIHAGETAKNQHNVRDAIKLAAEHGVRLRIGHGLHAVMDEEGEKNLALVTAHAHESGLANPDQFATERCMDSNQVYRTQMLVHNQPSFLAMQKQGVTVFAPRFLGTDGGGAIGTSPRQLAYSALATGMTLDDLAGIRQFEEAYVARQAAREALKTNAFETHYGSGAVGLDAFLQAYMAQVNAVPKEPRAVNLSVENPLLDYLPPIFQGKTPILIGGASGSSWEEMDMMDRDHVVRAMEMLVRCFDPKKTYFVLGRVQMEGVSKALDLAVKSWNARHPQQKFAVLGRLAGATKQPTADLADTIDWVQDIPQGRDYVPASMLAFLVQHKGRAIFFNGSDFTAEMAYGAGDRHVPHAVHEPLGAGDKMAEVAQTAETDSIFRDLDQFVAPMLQAVGPQHFFRNARARGPPRGWPPSGP